MIAQFKEETLFRIEFLDDFQLEYNFQSGNGHCGDFIEIRNGEDADSTFIMKECGWKKPPAITAIGSSVWMRFHTNTIGSPKKGFGLKITKFEQSDGKTNYQFETPFTELLNIF